VPLWIEQIYESYWQLSKSSTNSYEFFLNSEISQQQKNILFCCWTGSWSGLKKITNARQNHNDYSAWEVVSCLDGCLLYPSDSSLSYDLRRRTAASCYLWTALWRQVNFIFFDLSALKLHKQDGQSQLSQGSCVL